MTSIPFCVFLFVCFLFWFFFFPSASMASWLVTERVHYQICNPYTSEAENMGCTISGVELLSLISFWGLGKPLHQDRAFIYVLKVFFFSLVQNLYWVQYEAIFSFTWYKAFWGKTVAPRMLCIRSGQVALGKHNTAAYPCQCGVARKVAFIFPLVCL